MAGLIFGKSGQAVTNRHATARTIAIQRLQSGIHALMNFSVGTKNFFWKSYIVKLSIATWRLISTWPLLPLLI